MPEDADRQSRLCVHYLSDDLILDSAALVRQHVLVTPKLHWIAAAPHEPKACLHFPIALSDVEQVPGHH